MIGDKTISHPAPPQAVGDNPPSSGEIRSAGYWSMAYAAVFAIFLLLGIWTGKLSGTLKPARGPIATLRSNSPVPTPSNGQINLLIIGVDRLKSRQPRLESIWLLGYFPEEPHITLIPVFPVSPATQPAHLRSLEENLRISEGGRPGPEMLKTLHRDHIWWNRYVIVDEIAMIEIIDFLGGVQVNDQRVKGALAISSFPLPQEDPAASLEGQTRLLRGICQQANLLLPSADLRKILHLIPDHIQTDADIFQAIRDWRALTHGREKLACEFPLQTESLP
jgi:hypothetical protein